MSTKCRHGYSRGHRCRGEGLTDPVCSTRGQVEEGGRGGDERGEIRRGEEGQETVSEKAVELELAPGPKRALRNGRELDNPYWSCPQATMRCASSPSGIQTPSLYGASAPGALLCLAASHRSVELSGTLRIPSRLALPTRGPSRAPFTPASTRAVLSGMPSSAIPAVPTSCTLLQICTDRAVADLILQTMTDSGPLFHRCPDVSTRSAGSRPSTAQALDRPVDPRSLVPPP